LKSDLAIFRLPGGAEMIQELESQIIEITAELIAEEEIEGSATPTRETVLFGREGILDSMGLVSLIVAFEQVIEERFDVQISLADEKALSQERSPYRTIMALAEYAEAEIRDEQANA
jgi:acyl carrier protein